MFVAFEVRENFPFPFLSFPFLSFPSPPPFPFPCLPFPCLLPCSSLCRLFPSFLDFDLPPLLLINLSTPVPRLTYHIFISSHTDTTCDNHSEASKQASKQTADFPIRQRTEQHHGGEQKAKRRGCLFSIRKSRRGRR